MVAILAWERGLQDRLRGALGSSLVGGLGGGMRGNLAAALGGGGGVDLAGSFKNNLWSELECGLGSILEPKLFKCKHNFNPRCRCKNRSKCW